MAHEVSLDTTEAAMRKRARTFAFAAALAGIAAPVSSAEYMEKSQQMAMRAYSPGVITEGGRIVWLAGQTGFRDEQGKDVVGFDAQARQAFRGIDAVLKKAGGSLANMVTMTVFINDPRNGDRFVAIRREIFPDGNFPASALITVSNFAAPGMMLEIQGVAVIGDRCSNASPCSPR
jgi:2-iminobutanoate/2-iminopropanoate deaminase